MSFPQFKPGANHPTAAEMQTLSEAAARTAQGFTESGGLARFNVAGGNLVCLPPDRDIWIKVTSAGTLTGDVAAYDWEMVIRSDTTILSFASQRSGTATAFPAFEMNGNISVPINSIHRARMGESTINPGLEFCCLPVTTECVDVVTDVACVDNEIVVTTTSICNVTTP